MKSYVLGTAGDRILTIKKSAGQYVVTIKRKDDGNKFVELPPKRFVGFLCIASRVFLPMYTISSCIVLLSDD